MKQKKNTPSAENHLDLLYGIAYDEMIARGLSPAFPRSVLDELAKIGEPELPSIHDSDLRSLNWCSIDNDDSEDLDQLSVAIPEADGTVRVLVAIADVDGLVPMNSLVDRHAYTNTTSVYPAGHVFPMLPEKLSTNLTSLNPNKDRVAMITDMTFDETGGIVAETIYRGYVRNKAKLAYNTVGPWLEGKAPLPESVAAVEGLDENLQVQNRIAKQLRRRRDENGALNFQTIQGSPVFENNLVVELRVEERNDAKDLIEDLMVAVNGVAARFLDKKGYPTLRRVVKVPKRWDRMVEVAAQYKTVLPRRPDSKALNAFLQDQKEKDPERFPDLSLTMIKLLGSGEYVADKPGGSAPGHFGLAVADYSHSTAPNRRYPDLITQRILKAAIAGERSPYTYNQLVRMADHVTEMEDNAAKVERKVYKSAAALLLQDRIGTVFEGFVTGVTDRGSWVRIISVPVEGKLVQGERGLDVGDFVKVVLTAVDVERGFLDFSRVNA